MDYLSAHSNTLGYVLAVEKLLGIEMPDRVTWIRVLLAELQRLNSHLVWLGTHVMDLGAITVMLYTFNERERILNVNELIAGFRMFPSYIRVGGLREDLPDGFHQAVGDILDRLPGQIDKCEDLLTKNEIFVRRTRGIGVLSRADALAYGLVGPIARGSGVAYDVRKAFPYCGYETFDFDVPIGSAGDVFDRYMVRVDEMRQSLRICRQALERISPAGAVRRPTTRAWCRRRRTRSTPRWKRSSSTS